jgi:hypothetical protein
VTPSDDFLDVEFAPDGDELARLHDEHDLVDDLTDEQLATREMADWQLAAFERLPADKRAEFVRKYAAFERLRLGLEREPSTVEERQPQNRPTPTKKCGARQKRATKSRLACSSRSASGASTRRFRARRNSTR